MLLHSSVLMIRCLVSAVDNDELDWTAVCVASETQSRRWLHFGDEMSCLRLPAGDFIVDAVHVLQVFESLDNSKLNQIKLFYSVPES